MTVKRILFVTDTYYPDSGATTTIMKRTAEALAECGYAVDVYPAEISGDHYAYPDACNGVRIIQTVLEPRRHVCAEQCRSAVRAIERILSASDYDYIISGAVAFEINLLTHEAFHGRKYNWFPISYDPYAFDPHITEEQRQAYKKLEIHALQDAARVFFLSEFRGDYTGSPIEDKIVYFNLPCIRPIEPDRAKKAIRFDGSHINCVFLGDFYHGVENTDFIFRLFEKLGSDIRLYTVGNPGDYQETIDLWRRKLKDRYVCHARVSQEEAHNVMLDCDVLVSMGHDSPNMCPSKVIDYISSGKPILHISKIENCCAQKYLERYPNRYCIYQKDTLEPKRIREVESFLAASRGKARMPFDRVSELYSDFTLKALTDKLIKEFNNR